MSLPVLPALPFSLSQTDQPTMTTLQNHVVGYAYQGWGTYHCLINLRIALMQLFVGHARPLVNLVARFVRLRPVTVTLLTTDGFYDRIKNELARSFDPDEEALAARIRSVLSWHLLTALDKLTSFRG